jgi:hypothetical protein
MTIRLKLNKQKINTKQSPPVDLITGPSDFLSPGGKKKKNGEKTELVR